MTYPSGGPKYGLLPEADQAECEPMTPEHQDGAASGRQDDAVSKKDQIVSLYLSGMTEVEDLALLTNTRPSYVASVLHEEEFGKAYFDLYTSTRQPMNVYSRFFAGKLGFRDEEAAHRSVALIDRLHDQFELAGDRSGQHHALLMALTMFDRARWTGKSAEAAVFGRWLQERLEEATATGETAEEELETAIHSPDGSERSQH